MNMKVLTNRKFRRMFVSILSIFVVLAMAFLVTGSAYAQESIPWLIAFPENDAVEGWEWIDGATIYLTIDNAPEGFIREGTAHVTTWGDPRTYVRFDFAGEGGYDLQVGDMVTLTDEFGTSTTHEVQPLSVSGVEMDTDIVSGTANVGAQLQVWAHGQSAPPVDVTANDGTWQADLTDVYDITYGTGGRSQIMVDGNATAVDWNAPPPPPSPWLTAFPEAEYIEAADWSSEGLPVHIAIYDPNMPDEPVYQDDTTTTIPDWEPNQRIWAVFPLNNYDLKVGDLVVMTSGGTRLEHVVQYLTITSVEMDTNIVSGTANVGAQLQVWAHGQSAPPVDTAANDGTWQADLTDVYDITYGTGGRSQIMVDGNATAVDWYVPSPSFGVRANTDQVEGWEWTLGSTITVTVDDPTTVDNPDITRTAVVYEAPWNPEEFRFDLNLYGVLDIQPGFEVTVSDGTTTKTHTVTSLAFTEINIDTNTVSGIAEAGSSVEIWTCDKTRCYNSPTVVANGSGVWIADFTNIFDIVRGTWVDSLVRDDDGDSTMYGKNVPNPYIEAAPFSDWIHAREWPLGTLMTLEIDDPSDGLGDVDYSATAPMQQAPWNPNDPNDILADFRWPDEFAPGPGYVLTMSGNGQSKTLTITNLSVNGYDLDADTILGIGTPNAQIQVCVNVPNRCITRWVTTDGNGDWAADYGVPGTGQDDPDTFDVTPESNGWAADYEADSDRTWFDWHVPNPRMVVFPEWEWFDGNDWPDGATVTITVAGKPECETSKVSWGYFFNGNFGEGCDVVVGDVVTFTDGRTIRTHTVQNLAITKVNQEDDIVKGTADAGAEIHVWPHDTGQEQLVTANPQGKWNVDFTGIYDLMPGDGGRTEIRDEMGNATAVDWYIPRPRIVASITEDWFYLQEFTPNKVVSFTVYTSLGGKPIWKGTATTDGSGFAWIDAEGRWNLEPGNYLVVKDGSNSKDLVIEGFTFDVFNLSNGQLSGTAPSGRNVWVGIGFQDQDAWTMDISADGGTWIADFEQPVPSDYWWVAAQIFDSDGDASELRPASQIIFLRPSCGDTYTVQPNIPLEIRYGSWVAIGEELANQNAEHLTVELVLNGETLTGEKQSVVPRSEIPCGTPREDAYGVFYVAELGPLSSGTYIAEVTWILDRAVTDGYDADGDGESEWYGPGVVDTREFTIIVP